MQAKIDPQPLDDLTPDHLLRHSDELRESCKSGCSGCLLWLSGAPLLNHLIIWDLAKLKEYLVLLPFLILAAFLHFRRIPLINRLLDGLHDHVAEVIRTNAGLADLDLIRDELVRHLAGMKAGNRQINDGTRVDWLTDNYVRFCREHRLSAYPPVWRKVLRSTIALLAASLLWIATMFAFNGKLPNCTPGESVIMLSFVSPMLITVAGLDMLRTSSQLRDAAILHVYAGLLREEQSGGPGLQPVLVASYR